MTHLCKQVPVRTVVPEQEEYQVTGQTMVPEVQHIQVCTAQVRTCDVLALDQHK